MSPIAGASGSRWARSARIFRITARSWRFAGRPWPDWRKEGFCMFGARDPDWQADLARAGAPKGVIRPLFKEQSLWAIGIYRFGRRVDRLPSGLRRAVLTKIYWFLFRIVETLTGISLPKSCVIGKGLRIWHF